MFKLNKSIDGHKIIILLFIIILLTFLVYLPGIGGGFVFDDHANILNNEALHIESLNKEQLSNAIFSSDSGVLKRPISMLSFALNGYYNDFKPEAFKLTNLVIHLANGISIYFLSFFLLKSHRRLYHSEIKNKNIQYIALGVAAYWLLHPINLTGVLYIVQRMTSLAALFTFIGLCFYVTGRLRMLEKSGGILLCSTGIIFFTLVAALCKENGLLLPLLCLIIEIVLFRLKPYNPKTFTVAALLAVFAVFPILAALIYSALNPDWIYNGYLIRDFNLIERSMTEVRVIWDYIFTILAPNNSHLGLFHDDIIISKNLFDPLTTFFAIFGFIALLCFAFFTINRAPIFTLGIMFFLGGHIIESTILGLEIKFEHRNYLPSFGISLIVIYYLLCPTTQYISLKTRYLTTLLLLVVLAIVTGIRADTWGSRVDFATMEVINHPRSPRANANMADTYIALAHGNPENAGLYLDKAKHFFEQATHYNESYTDGLFGIIYVDALLGEKPAKSIIQELSERLENRPFAVNAVNQLNTLIDCHSKKCHVPPEVIVKLFQSALNNSTVTGSIRSKLYTSASRYSLVALGDLENALYLIAQAVEANPVSPRYRMHLANLLVLMNRYEDALSEINKVEKLDKTGQYQSEIKTLTSYIDQQVNKIIPK